MRIILFIISFILIAEAGVNFNFNKQAIHLICFALEGATEEELPIEKNNLSDKKIEENYFYNNNLYGQKQNYALSLKHNLPFISHTIFSPPPEC